LGGYRMGGELCAIRGDSEMSTATRRRAAAGLAQPLHGLRLPSATYSD
jgi:hypothetical protein